jgi:hypothetical protein
LGKLALPCIARVLNRGSGDLIELLKGLTAVVLAARTLLRLGRMVEKIMRGAKKTALDFAGVDGRAVVVAVEAVEPAARGSERNCRGSSGAVGDG